MHAIKGYLATAAMTAGLTTNEGCAEQTYPFPAAAIKNVMSPEMGDKTSTLVHGAVKKCLEGTFSSKDFDTAKNELGSEARRINIGCESERKAKIHVGIEGVCTSSFETRNGTDYTMGRGDCAAGH